MQTSAKPGQELRHCRRCGSRATRGTAARSITVDSGVRYQRFRGAGGALTDTSAWLIGTQLHPGTRAWLLRQLFGPGGINLEFDPAADRRRDFTAARAPYSYDELPPGQTDPGLTHFSIAHDRAYILPVLRQALALAERPFILASLWSPPGWMKINDSLSNIGRHRVAAPRGLGALAQYFVRFLQAYRRGGRDDPGHDPSERARSANHLSRPGRDRVRRGGVRGRRPGSRTARRRL